MSYRRGEASSSPLEISFISYNFNRVSAYAVGAGVLRRREEYSNEGWKRGWEKKEKKEWKRREGGEIKFGFMYLGTRLNYWNTSSPSTPQVLALVGTYLQGGRPKWSLNRRTTLYITSVRQYNGLCVASRRFTKSTRSSQYADRISRR